jgi:hypothetical protein
MHPSGSFVRDAQAEYDSMASIGELIDRYCEDHVSLVLVDGGALRELSAEYEPDFWNELAVVFSLIDKAIAGERREQKLLFGMVNSIRDRFAAAARVDYTPTATSAAHEAQGADRE